MMNIKLKAFLIALVYVTTPFVFLYVAFMYPLIILFAALALIFYMVYYLVLGKLQHEHTKKNGYSFKEFDDEYGDGGTR